MRFLSRRFILTLCAACLTQAGVVLIMPAAPAQAQLFLMSTDNQSASNNNRASVLGFTVTQNSIANIVATPVATLSTFDVIWINPGFGSYTNLIAGVAPGGSLEQYVAGGGTLVLNIAGNNGNQTDIAPGGVDYDRSSTHNAEAFTTPLHPYLTGVGYGGAALTPADFNSWSSTDHGQLFGLLPGTAVLNNTDGVSFVEYNFGSGVVLLNTLTYGWGSGGAVGAPRDNLLRYSAFVTPSASAAAPEPATLALLAMGLLPVAGAVIRRRRSSKA